MANCIAEYSFRGGIWSVTNVIAGAYGPTSVCNAAPAEPSLVAAAIRRKDGDEDKLELIYSDNRSKPANWTTASTRLPLAVRKLHRDSQHGQRKGNPMAFVSENMDVVGSYWVMDALVFYPCGAEWQDKWKVLY